MKTYKYLAQHMHMHSCYQPGASMEGHMYHARKLGMKYIWFTDHDIRMGRKRYQIDGFDFEQPELSYKEEGGRTQGFKEIQPGASCCKVELTKETCCVGTQCLKISASSDNEVWKGGGVTFFSNGNRHCSSLMAGVTLEIAAMAGNLEHSRVIFDVRLSQRPPEHECAHLLYVLGSTEGMKAEGHTAIIPLTPMQGWHTYRMSLSEDVLNQSALNLGGLDNAFDTLSIIVESQNGTSTTYFDSFVIHVKENFEAVRKVQKDVAKDKGCLYEITPFVATEISGAGPHKNCFSTKVPIIPYEDRQYQVSHEEAIAWVKNHNGIFALNHPFEKFKREQLNEQEKEERFQDLLCEFIKNKAWGATLMEVGYPLGRDDFSLEMHLRLWDCLTEAGILLTGYGSSDNHTNRSDWYDGNNFCNWLGVDEQEMEPVSEEAFQEAMKSRRLYMGNPAILKGEINFETEKGDPMGSILVVEKDESCPAIRFACDCTKPGWRFRLICNGRPITEEILSSERYEYRCNLQMEKERNYVRAELYNEQNVCIMLTNPIHILKKVDTEK